MVNRTPSGCTVHGRAKSNFFFDFRLHSDLQGAFYDVEYALEAVNSLGEAKETLLSIQNIMKDAIFHKNQLRYEHSRK